MHRASAVDGCLGIYSGHYPLVISTLAELYLTLLHLPALPNRRLPSAAARLVVALRWLNIVDSVVKAFAGLVVSAIREAGSTLLHHYKLAMLFEPLWRIHHLMTSIIAKYYGTALPGGCNRHRIPCIVGGETLLSI